MARRKNPQSETFSKQLAKLMELKGLTQQQAADAAKVSQPTVAKWLKGSMPDFIKLNDLAQANGVNVGYFLDVTLKPGVQNMQVLLDTWGTAKDDAVVKPKERSLPDLLEEVRRRVAKHGQKTALANELGVSRQAVDQWLSGDAKPSAELTFKLLNWVKWL